MILVFRMRRMECPAPRVAARDPAGGASASCIRGRLRGSMPHLLADDRGDEKTMAAVSDRAVSAFERIPARVPTAVALICDHASNRVPSEVGTLGVDPADLARHVGWDIGAADLTRGLAARLGAGAVLSRVSRLVVDCNRRPDHPTFILAESHGVAVPGNCGLSPEAVSARTRRYFQPFHDAVAAMLRELEAAGNEPALISIHSFTPQIGGNARWHFGVLYDRDRRLADALMVELADLAGMAVGDNAPYSGTHPEDIRAVATATMPGV